MNSEGYYVVVGTTAGDVGSVVSWMSDERVNVDNFRFLTAERTLYGVSFQFVSVKPVVVADEVVRWLGSAVCAYIDVVMVVAC